MQSEAAPSVDLTLNKGVLRDQNAPEVIKASGSDTAVESTKNVVDDATVGKKRNFFGTNARIKPLGAIEEAAPQAVEAAGGRAIQPVAAASGGEIQVQPAWSNLPDMVVAMIMTRVRAEYLSQMGKKEGDVMGAAHNLGAVCRSWRQIARHTFFSEWWAQGKIVHALQCFSLASSPLPGLLKCYVQRTQMRNCMRFTAYQGDRPDAVGSRFLMAADVNRFGMTLYLAKGESLPCARVSSNVFCTRYEFIKNHTVGPFDAPWQPPKKHESLCLADVEYRTRIRGCMRPRRMRVLLPDQSVLRKYGPHTAQATAQECGEVASEVDEAHGSAQSSPPGSFNASLKAATEVAKVSWESPERRRSAGWDSLPSGPALKPGEWLELENKAPHWNENLKCWCLNFRGRVKFASVKNFQLVDAANPDAIVMQFGKVAFNTYILDFQPGTICAAQAFAIALSAFNKGFSP